MDSLETWVWATVSHAALTKPSAPKSGLRAKSSVVQYAVLVAVRQLQFLVV